MGLNKGFKRTEAGIIPSDWTLRPFSSVVKIASGQVDPKIEPYSSMALVAPDHIESGTGRLLKIETAKEQSAISGKYLFSKGDIIYSKIRPYLKKVILAEFDGLCSADMYPLKPSNDVNSTYLKSSILAYRFSKYAESVSVRSGMPKINRQELAEFSFVFPPTLNEQEAIANAISDVDAYIESLEKLIEKKRLIKKGVMQELLTGKRRLGGFSADWAEFTLKDCLEGKPDYGINAAGSPSLPNLPTYLRITDIDDEGYLIPEGMIAVDHPMSKNYLLSENQIVFARTGASVGKTYLYHKKDGELIFAGFLIRGSINSTILNPEFFFFVTKSKHYSDWIKVMSMRSGQPGINGNEYASFQFKAPRDIKEQEAVAEILRDLSDDILSIHGKLKKAYLIKQGMMQELLTGRIRLV